MPFLLTLRTVEGHTPGLAPIAFVSLEAAYCDVCQAIPETAAALLRDGLDPMDCSYLICDADGVLLMEVPFTELVRRRRNGAASTTRSAARPAIAERQGAGRLANLKAAARAEQERTRRALDHAQALVHEADRLIAATALQLVRPRSRCGAITWAEMPLC